MSPFVSGRPPFRILLVFRVCNALLIQTYYSPDEYWQGPEVAHSLSFGRGHRTWEWESSTAIRSFMHPFLYTLPFQVLKYSGFDSWVLVFIVPKLVHAVMAAIADWCLFDFAAARLGPRAAYYVMLAAYTNWFSLFCTTRSLSNSIEAAAVTYFLHELGMNVHVTRTRLLLVGVIGAVSTAIRPSTCIFLVALLLHGLIQSGATQRGLRRTGYVCIGAATAASLCTCVDSLLYQRWTAPVINFTVMNAVQDVGRVYGVHPWYWYFLAGLPAVTGTMLPAVLAGAICLSAELRLMPVVILVYMLLLSLASHKEERFLLPVLPLCCLCFGQACATLDQWLTRKLPAEATRAQHWLVACFRSSRTRSIGSIVVIVPQLITAAYFCVFHQAGPISVAQHIASLASSLDAAASTAANASQPPMRVHFWTPCHSTPYFSVVHSANVQMDFFSCSLWWVLFDSARS